MKKYIFLILALFALTAYGQTYRPAHNITAGSVSATTITLPTAGTITIGEHTISRYSATELLFNHNLRFGIVTSGTWQGSSISTTYTDAKCTATWPNTYSANQNLSTTSSPTFSQVNVTTLGGSVLSNGIQGYTLDGSTGYLSIMTPISISSPFTIEGIIKTGSDVTTEQTVYENYNGTDDRITLQIVSGKLSGGIYNGSAIAKSGNIESNKIYNYQLVWDGSAIALYINGVSQGGTNYLNHLTTGSSMQKIGSSVSGLYFFSGQVHLTRLYNRALSAAEVTEHFNNGFPDRYVLPYADWGGSQTDKIAAQTDRDFSGANNWTQGSMTTFNASGDLSLAATAAGELSQLGQLYAPTIVGKKYRISCSVSNFVGSWILLDVTQSQTLATITGNGVVTAEFTASSSGGIRVYATQNNSSIDIDNFSLIEIGCVLDLEPKGVGHYTWADDSGNELSASVNGGCYPISNPDEEVIDSQIFTTDIASGTANKDITIPAYYIPTRIQVQNLTSGNFTSSSAVFDPTVTATVIYTGFTIGYAHPAYSMVMPVVNTSIGCFNTTKVIRFNLTGNTTPGARIKVWIKKIN